MKRRVGGQLRLWTFPDTPHPLWQPASLAIEWRFVFTSAPSTYGLLGGRPEAGPTRFELDGPEVSFEDSMASQTYEEPAFGLHNSYRRFLVGEVPEGLVVSVAAQGQVGSSPRVFASLAKLLLDLFNQAESATDQAIIEAARRSGLRMMK